MHTLLIHQAFVGPEEAGGTRHYEFARHCVDRGHKFSIVASDTSYLSGERTTKQDGFVIEELHDGVRVLRAYTYPALHRSFVWRIASFLSFMVSSVAAAMRVRNVDVVMGTTPPIFQAVSAWFVSLLRRTPLVLEVRDLWPEFAIDMGVLTNPVLIRISRRLERSLYVRADHLVVNSPAYREYLIEKGITPNRISFVPNGVDSSMFDPEARGEDIRSQYDLDDKFVITYAGALGMANDIWTILRAADLLRDNDSIHFLLVGDGKERNALEKEAGRLRLQNVTFTGSVPKARMPNLLAASDACLATLKDIPMFTTTFPNKVFDYMAAARPTILAIDGVIREVVEAAGGGVFVQPGDAKRLASAAQELSDAPEKAKEMGRSARAYVEHHYARADHAASIEALLDRVATSQ